MLRETTTYIIIYRVLTLNIDSKPTIIYHVYPIEVIQREISKNKLNKLKT